MKHDWIIWLSLVLSDMLACATLIYDFYCHHGAKSVTKRRLLRMFGALWLWSLTVLWWIVFRPHGAWGYLLIAVAILRAEKIWRFVLHMCYWVDRNELPPRQIPYAEAKQEIAQMYATATGPIYRPGIYLTRNLPWMQVARVLVDLEAEAVIEAER